MPRPAKPPIRRQRVAARLTRILVQLRPEVLARLRARAERERLSVSAIVAAAVERHLEQE